MDIVICVVVLFFTVLNLVLYHKLFDVYYFSLGHGLAKEIGASVLVAIVETALLMNVGIYILIFVAIGYGIVSFFKKRKDPTDAVDVKENINEEAISEYDISKGQAPERDVIGKNIVGSNSKRIQEEMFCSNCGNRVLKTANFCSCCGNKIVEK